MELGPIATGKKLKPVKFMNNYVQLEEVKIETIKEVLVLRPSSPEKRSHKLYKIKNISEGGRLTPYDIGQYALCEEHLVEEISVDGIDKLIVAQERAVVAVYHVVPERIE